MGNPSDSGAAGDVKSSRSAASTKSEDLGKWVDSPDYNPFKIPPDCDMFLIRDQERKNAQKKRKNEREAAVHEKHTHASRINHLTAQTRRFVLKETTGPNEKSDYDISKDWTLETTKDHPFGKEGIVEYINRKREMFLVKYAISVKREEMRKLEKLARDEEQKLVIAEQCLEDDAVTFDLFLKENDKSSVEAIRQAEIEMRKKLDKVAEVKRLSNIIRGIQTEISKQEEKLSELKRYRMFIDQLTPAKYRKSKKKSNQSEKAPSVTSETSSVNTDKGKQAVGQSGKASRTSNSKHSATNINRRDSIKNSRKDSRATTSMTKVTTPEEIIDESSDDEEVELYFKEPQELLAMFHELEDQNLSLIQNGQDMEENIDEIKSQANITRERLNRDVAFLAGQITMLEQAAMREEEKIEDLKLKCEMFSFGEFDQDDQEKLLAKFGNKVEEVYNEVIGENDANISTLQMLTSIENTFGQLLDLQEMMPEEEIAEYEKKFEKDRRARLREDKLREQEALQKERVQRALERAQAAPRNQVGRRPVQRSEPPRVKVKMRKNKEQLSMEQQEYRYFFEY